MIIIAAMNIVASPKDLRAPRNVRVIPVIDFTLPVDETARAIEMKELNREVIRALDAFHYGDAS